MGDEHVTAPVRIGFIGLDSSHPPAFTKLVHGVDGEPPMVAGATVSVAWPGEPSHDFEMSSSRAVDITRRVGDELGVDLVDTAEEVARRSDVVLITAVDPRMHPELVERVAGYGKPVYVDTRLALSSSAASRTVRSAVQSAAAIMCASPKRYAAAYTEALGAVPMEQANRIDIEGPVPRQNPMPGLFWYGVHMVDMVYRVFGTGCASVRAHTETNDGQDVDVVTAEWRDGRVAGISGRREWSPTTSGTITHPDGDTSFEVTAGNPVLHTGLLGEIVEMGRTGRSPVSGTEMVEVVRFLEAANQSLETGEVVYL